MTDQTENTTEKTETPVEEPESLLDAVKAAHAELSEDEPEAPVEASEAPTEAIDQEQATDDAQEDAAPVEVSAPEWWGDNVEVWNSLPEEARTRFGTLYEEQQKAIETERLDPAVRGALAQIEENARLYGATTDQALSRLFNAHRMLETNPRHALMQLARQYGYDLSQFAAPEGAETEQADDPITAVRSVVQQELGQFRQELTEQQTRTALTELQEWADEKGADGQPLRPHFEELQHLVAPEMDRLLQANPQRHRWDALDEAYRNVAATKAPAPDIDKLVAERVEQALKAQAEEAKKSQRASISPRSSASSSAPVSNGSAGSVRDDVAAAAAEMGFDRRI